MLAASATARRLGASLALAGGSTLLGLGLLEAACRARAALAPPAALQAAREGVIARGGPARLGNLVRLSPDPRIVYELIPDLDVTFMGAPLRTNADGFRGPAIDAARARPAVRVVGLGDSVMFGWGVREEDAYLARLRGLLEAASPGVAWQIVNTAVPGYNTVMEVETLEAKGLRFDPDLVILNFVGNDLGLPNFVEEGPDVLSLRRSFLFDFARARLLGLAEPGPRLVGTGPEARRSWGEAEPARVPARYRGLVGLDSWRAAMRRLHGLARAHRFEVVALAHPEATGYLRDAAREHGFMLVETAAAVRSWAAAHGIERVDQPPLTVTGADPHPSALGHEIVAAVLAERLRSAGLVERLAARRGVAGSTPRAAPVP